MGEAFSFDPDCCDLAEHFLSDEPALNTERNKKRLAQHIQDTVEDWIAYEREDPLPIEEVAPSHNAGEGQ